jgi:hypothetical protein
MDPGRQQTKQTALPATGRATPSEKTKLRPGRGAPMACAHLRFNIPAKPTSTVPMKRMEDSQETARHRGQPLQNPTGCERDGIRESAPFTGTRGRKPQTSPRGLRYPIEPVRLKTGQQWAVPGFRLGARGGIGHTLAAGVARDRERLRVQWMVAKRPKRKCWLMPLFGTDHHFLGKRRARAGADRGPK